MPRSRENPDEDSCEASFRDIVLSCALDLDAALAVFLETDDPAGPHKARVALRRLTTALDAFRPLLRRKPSAALRSRAKHIFRDLGAVRDLDVHLSKARERDRSDKLSTRNQRLRDMTRHRMRKKRFVGFTNELRNAVGEDGILYRRSPSARRMRSAPIVRFAAETLDRAWQRSLGYGPSVRSIPETDRHEFRKDMKTMRYLSEFFADFFPGLESDPFRSDMRDIQDSLGVLNDYAVSLAIEDRKPPKQPPEQVANALADAERLWKRLSQAMRPWGKGLRGADADAGDPE